MNFCKQFPGRILICRSLFGEFRRRNIQNIVGKNVNITSSATSFLQPPSVYYDSFRQKSKKPQYDSDDDDDDKDILDDSDFSLNKDSKVVKFNTTSMRTDAILKSALGVARNKIEQAFYESKIRVNGKKILKKSMAVRIGDELDIIKMVSPKNPEHLYISRVEVINAVPKEESIGVTVRRFKNLLIENYEEDPYKAGSSENEQ